MIRLIRTKTPSYMKRHPFFGSLGITQHLIKGGIASLEEVRGPGGDLEDLFIRVCGSHLGLGGSTYLTIRLTARKCSRMVKK